MNENRVMEVLSEVPPGETRTLDGLFGYRRSKRKRAEVAGILHRRCRELQGMGIWIVVASTATRGPRNRLYRMDDEPHTVSLYAVRRMEGSCDERVE